MLYREHIESSLRGYSEMTLIIFSMLRCVKKQVSLRTIVCFFISIFLVFVSVPPPVLAAEQPIITHIPGPKRTIAVGQIEAAGGFEVDENWDVGDGLASMLTTALVESQWFHVPERGGLASLLNEKKLQTSNLVDTANQTGRMTLAQYLIFGSVTEFGGGRKGSGLSIGSSFGGALGGLGVNKKTGRISLDLRLIDTSSGNVLASFTVSEKVSRTGTALQTSYKGVAMGGDQFVKTPLGEASRAALKQAVVRIAQVLAAQQWYGRIVTFEDNQAIINAGSEGGVREGDRFRVERVGETLTDPETGRVLSEGRYFIGELVVHALAPEVAFAHFTPSDGQALPIRGDLVIPLQDGG